MVSQNRGFQDGIGAQHADPASGAGIERRGHWGLRKNVCSDLEVSTRWRMGSGNGLRVTPSFWMRSAGNEAAEVFGAPVTVGQALGLRFTG